jgi:magnesium transporter
VVQHVRRLEHNTETAVQMHFNAQSNRTNDTMRMLTALTAIFLPLNLIAGIFGMNFEFMPWLHQATAFWWTLGSMVLIAVGLGLFFWRKRYLARTGN